MALTKEQLVTVAKTEDLKSIQALRLESMELTACFKLLLREMGISLYLLSLKNNCLNIIDIPLGFTNLRKLDLSTNFLTNIGSKDLWNTMPRLQVLYLHDNLLETWETFTSLAMLPHILHLTLFNNPCIHLPHYRKYILSALPSLLALDFHISTQEERLGLQPPDPEKSKIWIQDSPDMKNFRNHIYKLKRKFEKCSPSIRIQSLWRSYYVRKHTGGHLSERDQTAIIIQKHVRGWLLRLRLRKDLEKLLKDTDNDYLLYTPEQYKVHKAVTRIQSFYRKYIVRRNYKRKINNASAKISSNYKRWKQFRLKIPILKSTKIYVLKSQQRTLICLLRALAMHNPDLYHPANSIYDRMAPEFFQSMPKKKTGLAFPLLFDRITDCKTIKVIRFPDIENLSYSYIPLLQMSKWITHAKILNSNEGRSISGKSITKRYCNNLEYQKLSKFKIRGSIITQAERKKYKSIKLNLDDYLDLVEFNAPSEKFVQELFLMVLDYNKIVFSKDLPIFLPIFEVLLHRVRATCTVQACWRGYAVRKQGVLAKLAIEKRSIYCIQRWWRSIKFLYRMKSLMYLKSLLAEYTSPIVYMEEHLFQYLSISTETFLFLEQHFTFYCSGETPYINPFYKKKFLPDWVGCQCRIDYSGGIIVSDEEKTLQAIVLSGARVGITNLSNEVEKKPIMSNSNVKFIKLEYKSIDEAKRRVAILYLKTLDHRTRSYVPLFTRDMLSHPFLMSKLRKIWKNRNINATDYCPAIDILSKALNPTEENIKYVKPPEVQSSPTKIEESHSLFKPQAVLEFDSEVSEIHNQSVDNIEALRQKVKYAREESQRKQAELKFNKQIELEMKMSVFREAKEHTSEIFNFRKNIEEKELELKRSFIEAQARKKQIFLNEKMFIRQFAQAKNMIGKLMKLSDLERHKNKSHQDVKDKVADFKQKNKDKRELIQAILYQKFKNTKRSTL
jgi:Leucine-rich repeat/IQ calmodulin-binding motif